ncbi:MAG: cytochrome c biogenesis protein [Phycisphaerales bacterium]
MHIALLGLMMFTMVISAATSTGQDRKGPADFEQSIDLASLGKLALSDNGRLKSLDSYTRAVMQAISGSKLVNGQSPTFTYFDLMFRPQRYVDVPAVYVHKKPVRARIAAALRAHEQELASRLTGNLFPDAQAAIEADIALLRETVDELMADGLVSATMLNTPMVAATLNELRADLVRTARFVEEIDLAAALMHPLNLQAGLRIVPPPGGNQTSAWLTPEEIVGSGSSAFRALADAWNQLESYWAVQDAGGVNNAIAQIAKLTPEVNAALYPSPMRSGWPWSIASADERSATLPWFISIGLVCVLAVGGAAAFARKHRRVGMICLSAAILMTAMHIGALALGRMDWLALESFYFRNYHWYTLIWVVYMFSVIFLLMAIAYRWRWASFAGLSIFVIALLLHTAGLLLRWHIADRWPNSNMFEAVTTAAWFGGVCAVFIEILVAGTIMRHLFALGSAAASMTALMAAHFLPQALNASISNKMPVLDDVWLYIHTNVIIFSYCLIFMAAMVAGLYLFYRLIAKIRHDGTGAQHYARIGGAGSLLVRGPGGETLLEAERTTLGQVFDGATMILMELSFILLWAGIVMGAIWADHSWGRPWGWDPKEVFALNTFIVFAVLVHVRLKAKDKGLWTSLLTIAGCVVMLFNWIFINFKIAGLHSYA